MEKNIFLSDREFNSKKDVINFYKNILNSYNIGDEISNEDFEIIYNLLKNHPHADKKIGCGIEKIIIDKDDYNHKCFHIIRKDGSKDNFSYLKCINGEPNNFKKFSEACRKAVAEDIIAVKIKYFNENANSKNQVKCQQTGKYISFDEAHVDHRLPNTFSVIVDRFIEVNNIDIANVKYDNKEKYGCVFKDKELEMKFREYHKKMAKLRIVEGKKNLSMSKFARIHQQKKDILIN